MNKSKLIILGLTILIGLSVIQALYYPFMESPEIANPSWWQMAPLAGFGFLVGFPVFLVSESIPFMHNNKELSVWSLTLLYSVLLFIAFNYIANKLKNNAKNS